MEAVRIYETSICSKETEGKAVPQHTYGGARGDSRYSSYSFTTSALDGGE